MVMAMAVAASAAGGRSSGAEEAGAKIYVLQRMKPPVRAARRVCAVTVMKQPRARHFTVKRWTGHPVAKRWDREIGEGAGRTAKKGSWHLSLSPELAALCLLPCQRTA